MFGGEVRVGQGQLERSLVMPPQFAPPVRQVSTPFKVYVYRCIQCSFIRLIHMDNVFLGIDIVRLLAQDLTEQVLYRGTKA